MHINFSLKCSADPPRGIPLWKPLDWPVTSIVEPSQKDYFHHLATERSGVLSCTCSEHEVKDCVLPRSANWRLLLHYRSRPWRCSECCLRIKKNSTLSEKTCLTDTCAILDYSHTDTLWTCIWTACLSWHQIQPSGLNYALNILCCTWQVHTDSESASV